MKKLLIIIAILFLSVTLGSIAVAKNNPNNNSMTIVSDGTEENATTTWTHPSWPEIEGAKWIWSTYKVQNPEEETVEEFSESFSVKGVPTNATLTITADNKYVFYINGKRGGEDGTWEDIETYSISDCLRPGENNIRIEVTNYEGSDNPENNPAGVIYRLDINYQGGKRLEKGNNGVGNGIDPQPKGNPPVNDGPETGPGNPGNRGGAK